MIDLGSETTVFPQATPTSSPAIAPGEIIIGSLAGIDGQGQPLVDYPENPSSQPVAALSTVNMTSVHIGRTVALLFAQGDPQRPVIIGLIHSPLHDLIVSYDANTHEPPTAAQPASPSLQVDDITLDGKRIVLAGKEEVVIQCGEASITLTKAGKILIRGHYLLNRSSGVNRIMGGSVQVN